MTSRIVHSIAIALVLLSACKSSDSTDSGPSTRTVTVQRTGSGAGSVTSSPSGINCGSTCSASLSTTTPITLTAAPSANSTFTNWSGACTGTNSTCTVPAGTTTVSTTAQFDLTVYTLTVALAGTGTGTVTSSAAGINCGTDCTEGYPAGTAVLLTAAPSATSTFTGWSGGGCTGTGPCTVTVNAATTVTATFAIVTNTLTVTLAGTGGGVVTSAPAGINCGADCTEPYNFGTVVTLTAASAAGSNFTGWSGGGCTGTGTCIVTMNAATTVTATFTLVTNTLTVTLAGTGSGTVTSAPAGINCAGDCSEAYNFGTAVTLTAAASATSTFTGWSGGGCTGTGTCVVTVNQATAVTATFDVFVPGWPDSGTRFCTNITAAIACPGGPVGQDGFYEINVPTYVVAGGRVQDPITGLVWERSPPITNMTHAAATSYCNNLTVDGITGWRLPSYLELVSIADFGTTVPGFTSSAFPGIPQNSNYWTSTDRAATPTQALGMNTNYPTTSSATKTDATSHIVRCVRATTLSGALTVSGGSVTDARTKLVWQSGTAPTDMTWQNALAYCEALVLDGRSDWRLPNGKELMSIVDLTLTSPSISPLFTSRPSTSFWTSSVIITVPDQGYVISFDTGLSDGIGTVVSSLRSVRCVR